MKQHSPDQVHQPSEPLAPRPADAPAALSNSERTVFERLRRSVGARRDEASMILGFPV